MGRFARKFKRQNRRQIMRRFHLSPRQFNYFFWPMFRNQDTRQGDPEVLLRLTRHIKAGSHEVPLTPEEQRLADEGQPVFPDRVIDGPVTFYLEEDEHRQLRGVIKSGLSNFNVLALEEAHEVFQIIDGADEFDPSEGQAQRSE